MILSRAKSKAKQTRRSRRQTRRAANPRWLLIGILAYLGLAGTGIGVARYSQEYRSLFYALEQDQRAQDKLLARYSRLLLERSTLASYQNVDDIAEQRLGMRFPEHVERVALPLEAPR